MKKVVIVILIVFLLVLTGCATSDPEVLIKKCGSSDGVKIIEKTDGDLKVRGNYYCANNGYIGIIEKPAPKMEDIKFMDIGKINTEIVDTLLKRLGVPDDKKSKIKNSISYAYEKNIPLVTVKEGEKDKVLARGDLFNTKKLDFLGNQEFILRCSDLVWKKYLISIGNYDSKEKNKVYP